jgi:[ribosomal protein S5]-alanine N-acetyltransferase
MHIPLATLSNDLLTLRELDGGDAESLFSVLSTPQVSRFISMPPRSPQAFGRFIKWASQQREEGRLLCFGVVPRGHYYAVGVVQVRPQTRLSETAEWGFALGEAYWGTGLFVSSAALLLDHVFETTRLQRLEARTMVDNPRGNGVLRKLGASREALLREGFAQDGRRFDQWLWAILRPEWRRRHPRRGSAIVVPH